jgi:hypothetical protein
MTPRTSIGGPLDWATLYGRDQHRPTEPAAIGAAARELAASGLKVRDIADALRLSEGVVSTLLRDSAASPSP